MAGTNTQVVRLLNELAQLTELEDGSSQSFRVRAYQNAARAVEGLTTDVAEMTASKLAAEKGIGKSTAAKIRQFVDEGVIDKLETLREQHPPGKLELLRINGLGAKTVQLLDEALQVRSVEDLRAAIDDGRMAKLPGMGVKTIENLRASLDAVGAGSKDRRVPSWQALPIARELVASITALPEVLRAEYAGSLRRMREDIGDLDILAAVADMDDAPAVMEAFRSMDLVDEVVASGETKTTIRTRELLQVDLRVVDDSAFGAALVYFTGSKAHNIKLRERAVKRKLTLNEYALAHLLEDDAGTRSQGDAIAAATEHDVYAALDLSWVPPEAREDRGEVELAADDALPELIEVGHLLGDLHDHSTYSGDGRVELPDLIAEIDRRGLDYFAITDHAEDLTINGISRAGMLEQRARLRELQEQHTSVRLLHGVELNIGRDGTVDYDQEFVDGFDWCVASVHSHFTLSPAEQTERLLTAIRNPAVNVIGHLSGRRIGKRAGIDFDLDAVLDACLETGTALEINANPQRLDATWDVIRAGGERGVFFVISTDAHAISELDHVASGVAWARRAMLPRELVANAWDTERFLDWTATVRRGT